VNVIPKKLLAALLVASVVPASTGAQGLGGAASREKERLKKREAVQSGPQRITTTEELAPEGGRAAWKAPDGSFQVAFPGTPETKQGDDGGTTFRIVSAGTLFSVNVRDLTAEDLPRALDDYRAAALRYLRETSLVSEAAVTSGSTIGRELVVGFSRSRGGRGVMRTRAFVSGTRLYSLVVMVESGRENDADVLAFHDSFRMLK
jgi:hypothetical protein